MLTGMMEDDWVIVLKVFAAAQSRCGQPGHDDRTFLAALHFFTVHNLTWRALLATFGRWNSIWKRFWRLSRSSVMEAFFQLLAETSGLRIWCKCSTARPFGHTSPRPVPKEAGEPGSWALSRRLLLQNPPQNRLRRSADRLSLTGGEVHDTTQFSTPLDIGPDITPRAAVTDKATTPKRTVLPVANAAASSRPSVNLSASSGSSCVARKWPKASPLL
jgi:transposase